MTYSDEDLQALWEHTYFRASISRNNARNWWALLIIFLAPIWLFSFPQIVRWFSLLISAVYILALLAALRAWKRASKGSSSYTPQALFLITVWNGLSIFLMSLAFLFGAIGFLFEFTNGLQWIIWVAVFLYVLIFLVAYFRGPNETKALTKESPGERFSSTRGVRGLLIGMVLFAVALIIGPYLQDFFQYVSQFVIFLGIYAISLLLLVLFVPGIYTGVVIYSSGLDKSPYTNLPK